MIFIGLALLLLGIVMLMIHLKVGKGIIVDPISISWLGYLMFIPSSILLAAGSQSDNLGVRSYVLLIYIIASLFYIIGLYSGRAGLLTKILPVPSETLNPVQLWIIIFISGILLATFWFGIRVAPPGMLSIIMGINGASIGAMVLLGFYTIICYRGHYVTKLLTGILAIVMLILMLDVMWSRRPVIAVLFSAICLFYYKKLLWRSAGFRFTFWSVAGVLGVLLLFYLNMTRVERFYGVKSFDTGGLFSAENLDDFAGGISVGHLVFEKVVFVYQNETEFSFQYGKTYIPGLVFWIPRSIWPSKPNTGGGIASLIWFNMTDAPSNVSPTPFGEAYINFGFLGAIIVPFFAGWFVRGLNTFLLNHQSNEVLWLTWFAIIPDFATQWRGDFTSMFVQAFTRVSLILILAWITKGLGGGYNANKEFDLNESSEGDDGYQ